METETTDLVSSDMLQQIPAPAKKHPKRTNSSVSSFVLNTTHMDIYDILRVAESLPLDNP